MKRNLHLARAIYVSRAARAFSPNEVLSLCSSFASANARRDVTGVLLYVGDHFFQVLEGWPDDLPALIEAIRNDPRHVDFRTVLEEPLAQRLFASWSMGLINTGDQYQLGEDEVCRLRDYVLERMQSADSPRDGVVQFIQGLPALLRRCRKDASREDAVLPRGAAEQARA